MYQRTYMIDFPWTWADDQPGYSTETKVWSWDGGPRSFFRGAPYSFERGRPQVADIESCDTRHPFTVEVCRVNERAEYRHSRWRQILYTGLIDVQIFGFSVPPKKNKNISRSLICPLLKSVWNKLWIIPITPVYCGNNLDIFLEHNQWNT